MTNILYQNYHRDADYKKFEGMFRNIFQTRFNIISKFCKNSGKVLEIGASVGTFLQIFKERGWECWGVEPSKSASVSEKKGIKVIKNYFEKASLPKNYFDLIIMNHTLEHMEDPFLILNKIYKVLKKDGIVFIDVPNYGGLGSKLLDKDWPYLLPDEHLHQFTKKDLTELLKKEGFKVLHSESRSGIFEYADPLKELFDSLFAFKKRFFTELFTFPYALTATWMNMGDSISIVGRKE